LADFADHAHQWYVANNNFVAPHTWLNISLRRKTSGFGNQQVTAQILAHYPFPCIEQKLLRINHQARLHLLWLVRLFLTRRSRDCTAQILLLMGLLMAVIGAGANPFIWVASS